MRVDWNSQKLEVWRLSAEGHECFVVTCESCLPEIVREWGTRLKLPHNTLVNIDAGTHPVTGKNLRVYVDTRAGDDTEVTLH